MVKDRITWHGIPLCAFDFLCHMYVIFIFKTFLKRSESFSVVHVRKTSF